MDDTKQSKKERCWSDYKAQTLYIEAMQEAKDDMTFDPRRDDHVKSKKDGRFKMARRGKGGKRVNKGDCVLTDCNVTGTNVGTPDKPKFALRPLWEYSLLPSLDALVAEGGQCAGAIVVHQEDNAGCDATHSLTMTLTVFSVITLTHTLSLTLTLTIPRTIGPHKEGGFHAWLTCEFERRG